MLPGYKKPVIIDYLSGIVGVPTKDVEKFSVPLSYEGASFRILHLVLCVESKFQNLFRLAAKRTPEGIEQARLATVILRAFLLNRLDDNAPSRNLLNILERSAAFATTEAAQYVKHQHGFDILHSLPLAELEERRSYLGAFFQNRLPQLRLKSAQAERKYSNLLVRRSARTKPAP